MKFVLFVAIAIVIAGGVYHEDVSRYVSSVAKGPSGGSPTVVNSFKGTGNSGNNLMGGIGNTLDR